MLIENARRTAPVTAASSHEEKFPTWAKDALTLILKPSGVVKVPSFPLCCAISSGSDVYDDAASEIEDSLDRAAGEAMSLVSLSVASTVGTG